VGLLVDFLNDSLRIAKQIFQKNTFGNTLILFTAFGCLNVLYDEYKIESSGIELVGFF